MAGRHLSLFLRKSPIMVINVLHLCRQQGGLVPHRWCTWLRQKVQVITAWQNSCANHSGNDGILGTIILCVSVNGANRDCSITKAYWSFHPCSRMSPFSTRGPGRSTRLSSLEMSFVAPSSPFGGMVEMSPSFASPAPPTLLRPKFFLLHHMAKLRKSHQKDRK